MEKLRNLKRLICQHETNEKPHYRGTQKNRITQPESRIAIAQLDEARAQLAALRVEVERLRADELMFKEVCFLIGSIYFYGNFKAETWSERKLEERLRLLGYFFESEEQVIDADMSSLRTDATVKSKRNALAASAAGKAK